MRSIKKVSPSNILPERSFFIKGHYGNETSFSSSHKVQTGGGPYTKATTRGNGTVYVVCGVSGQKETTTSSGYPHNAMFYSSTSNYGSLVIDVSGGSLSCKFLASNGTIPDQFTITKPTTPSTLRASSYIFLSDSKSE